VFARPRKRSVNGKPQKTPPENHPLNFMCHSTSNPDALRCCLAPSRRKREDRKTRNHIQKPSGIINFQSSARWEALYYTTASRTKRRTGERKEKRKYEKLTMAFLHFSSILCFFAFQALFSARTEECDRNGKG
jgi:hypothetical protein